MKKSANRNGSTSRRSRQNVAPGVSPGNNDFVNSQPSKRAAEHLSPLKGLKGFLTRRSPGLRPGLYSSAIFDGSLSNLLLVPLSVIVLLPGFLLITRGSAS